MRKGWQIRTKGGAHKAEQSTIPEYLDRAFYNAAHAVRLGRAWTPPWSPADPDQKLFDVKGKCCSISEVCTLVEPYSDRLPEYGRAPLCPLITTEEFGGAFGQDVSYATAARCLRELVKQRISEYQADLEWRTGESARGSVTTPRL
jgi:hypothetical protein